MDKPDATPKPHIRWDRKNALIGLAVLLVLVASGLTWYFMTHKTDEPVSKESPKSVINRALNTRDGATRLQLEEAMKNKPSKEEKQQLLQFLANDAQKRGDFAAAVSYLRQTYDSGLQTANLVQGIGMLYLEKLNNKPEALKYFRLGVQAANSNSEGDPFAGDVKAYMEQKVKDLEAEGVQAAK